MHTPVSCELVLQKTFNNSLLYENMSPLLTYTLYEGTVLSPLSIYVTAHSPEKRRGYQTIKSAGFDMLGGDVCQLTGEYQFIQETVQQSYYRSNTILRSVEKPSGEKARWIVDEKYSALAGSNVGSHTILSRV